MVKRPRLLDLYCKAGGAAMGYHRVGFEVVGVDSPTKFSNFGFQFSNTEQQSFDVRVIQAVMLRLAIKFKVLNSVIVLNAVHMVDFLSLCKATSKMLCHYKTMLINITILPCHRKVRTIWREFDFYISEFCNLPAALPTWVSRSNLVPFPRCHFTSTRSTPRVLRFAVSQKDPLFPPAIRASKPHTLVRTLVADGIPWNYISNLHILSIAQNGVNING